MKSEKGEGIWSKLRITHSVSYIKNVKGCGYIRSYDWSW